MVRATRAGSSAKPEFHAGWPQPARRPLCQHRPPMALPSPRHLFSIPDDVAYLNCAYMGPLPTSALDAGRDGLARKAAPWEITGDDFFALQEQMRELLAGLLDGDAEGVAVTPSVSYGLATAAANLAVGPGQQIVVLADQFPSNVYVWRELAERRDAWVHAVDRPADGDATAAVLAHLDRAGDEVAVVALAPCHWTDGSVVDLEAVGARCRELGAALVVDVCQALGALPFSVAAVQPDFVAGACYKWLLGPYSVGFLWAAPSRRAGSPLEHNWITRAGSDRFSALIDYTDDFQPGARRYDVGETSNFALLPVAIEALRLVTGWGVGAVAAHAAGLTARIAEGAADLGFAVAPPHLRTAHLMGLRRPGLDTGRLAAALAAEKVHVSIRGDAVRVSAHVFNTADDADRLLAALGRAVA